MEGLLDLDSIEVLVIVDNELDPISPSPSDNVHQEGGIKDIAMRTPRLLDDRGKSVEYDLPMSRICHAAHGLSLLITACRGGERHCILMDGGPEAAVLEQNATRLNAETGYVERIFLSHWHTDHSGGLLKALDMIYAGRTASHLDMGAVIVDLHPGRPDRRGVRLKDSSIIALEADPTIADIKARGGEVDLQDSEHLVLHGMFLVSGEIPRVNDYENGIESGMSFDYREGTWKTDELICDERFLMCRLKGTNQRTTLQGKLILTIRRKRYCHVHGLQPRWCY